MPVGTQHTGGTAEAVGTLPLERTSCWVAEVVPPPPASPPRWQHQNRGAPVSASALQLQ